MTRPNTDHITVRNIDEGQLFVCAHCGNAQIVSLPICVDTWLKISRRFQQAHRHCRPPAELNQVDTAENRLTTEA